MLVKQEAIGAFEKCKKCLQNKKVISDAAFKAWPFLSDFNFACKHSQVTAAKCKYYCPLVVNFAITKLQRALHLK